MKALVTGASGFLGSHLVESLLKKGFAVKCVVRNPKKLSLVFPDLDKKQNFEFVCGDCADRECFESAVSGVDYVFHLAGLVRALRTDELYETNVGGTKNLIESVFEKNSGLKRFIYVSSQAASGPSQDGHPLTESVAANPVSHYGFSKLLGELEVLKFKDKLPVTIMRPPSIYGPRDKDVFVFFKYARQGFLPIPKEEKFINISYVSDICNGLISAAMSEKTVGKTYFIGDETVFSWENLCEVLRKSVNPKANIIRVPQPVFLTSALISSILAEIKNKPAVISFDKLKELKQKNWLFSTHNARLDFGYFPKISLEEGIKITYNWYKSKGWL